MPTTTTRLAIRQEAMRQLFSPRFPITGTASGTHSVTTLQDNVLLPYSSGPASLYDGLYVHVLTALGASKGVSRVARNGFNVNGTLTLSPALASAPADTDIYELYYEGLHRNHFNDGITRLMRKTFVPRFLPLSLVADADMEASGVANWANVGSPSTREKVTVGANDILFGTQSLHVVGNTGEGVTSDAFNVHDVHSLSVWVYARTVSGSLDVILRNATGSANVRTVRVDETGWTLVKFREPLPDGMEQATIRLLSGAASSEWFVGAVIVLSPEVNLYPLPSSVQFPEQIRELVIFNDFLGAETQYTYVALSGKAEVWPHWESIRDDRAVNASWISLDARTDHPLFLDFSATLPVVGDDTTSLRLDLDYAAARLMAYIRRYQANEAVRDKHSDLAAQRRNDAAELNRRANNLGRKLGYSSAAPYVRVREAPRVLV